MDAASAAQTSHDEDDGDEEENDMSGMTMKDILNSMRGRKRTGIPMPSTVERLKVQRKKRREERIQDNTSATPDGGNEGNSGGGAAPSDTVPAADSARENGGMTRSGDNDVSGTPTRGADDVDETPVNVLSAEADKSGDGEDGGDEEGGGEEENEDNIGLVEPVVVAPKVTVDSDGNIVIDKESLVISAGTGPTADFGGAEVVTIDNNDRSRHITSASFVKRDSATKWTPEDNEKFFTALSQFGTDFALIEYAFPGRSRRQIKLKFKREERENPAKLEHYLSARTRMSVADTRKTFGLHGSPSQPMATVGASDGVGRGSNWNIGTAAGPAGPGTVTPVQPEFDEVARGTDGHNGEDENAVPPKNVPDVAHVASPADVVAPGDESVPSSRLPVVVEEEEEEYHVY
jgi:Myb DNA-binding like